MPDIEDAAVEGRLPALGGCGKEAMLIVRRRVLSGLPGVRPLETDRTALKFEVELELDSGDRRDGGLGLDGVRSLDGWYGDADRGASGAGVLFRALGVGSGGKDPVGGFVDGRDGVGRVDMEAMVLSSLAPVTGESNNIPIPSPERQFSG